jgi:hypothetical protein
LERKKCSTFSTAAAKTATIENLILKLLNLSKNVKSERIKS